MTEKPQADAVITSLPTRDYAGIFSILFHAVVIALVLLAMRYLPHRIIVDGQRPIAVTMLAPPDEAAEPQADAAPSAEQAAPAEAAAATPEQEAAPEAQPDDAAAQPYYNPFSSNAQVEIRESPHETPPDTGQSEVQATEGMLGGDGANGVPANGPPNNNDANGQGETIGPQVPLLPRGGPGPVAQQGNPDGDPLLHPQFLSIRLTGFVNVLYTEEMHQFLRRLIQCGVVPVISQTPNLSVEADVSFTPMGTVQATRLTNQGEFTDPAYDKAATALLGALTNPTCSYIHLPPQNFPAWHNVHLSFYQHIPGP